MKVFIYLKICLLKILSDIRAECNEYVINGVRYIVSSRFEETKITMKERLEKFIGSDFAHLSVANSNDTMIAECVNTSTGERRINAVG